MSDFEFEARLERLFAQPPAVADSAGFAARVEARLERGWGARQLVIAAAGVLGGTVAGSQALGAGVWSRLQGIRLPTGPLLGGDGGARLTGDAFGVLLGGGEVMWMAAGMAAVTAAFVVTRFSDAF